MDEGIRTLSERVVQTDVEGGVRVRGKRHPRLANGVLGFSVLVSERVFDLFVTPRDQHTHNAQGRRWWGEIRGC